MSSENRKVSKKENLFNKYLVYIFSFLTIALAFTVMGLFIVNTPVTNVVHKLEDNFKMLVRDVEIDDNTYFPNVPDGAEPENNTTDFKVHLGDKIANVSIESCGLNCSVYYGINRVSMRNGAGLSSILGCVDSKGRLNHDSMLVIKGYDETFFSSLKYAEIGDIVTLDSNFSPAMQYRIVDAKYISEDVQPYSDDADAMLVLCGICSDFSEHSGERYYVFADLIGGEGN
ncbi:MAG: sortase [Eubacterium sp.]|nr:sortase [Eubacterium sp.]MDE6155810.1 sortase [Eubacterium sp.]MDE6766941.1 sortase [Eubacterium sp.]